MNELVRSITERTAINTCGKCVHCYFLMLALGYFHNAMAYDATNSNIT